MCLSFDMYGRCRDAGLNVKAHDVHAPMGPGKEAKMNEFGLSHRSFAHHATTVGGWLRSRVSSLSRVLGITIVKHSFTWINLTPGYQPSQSGRDQGDSASVQHLNQATVAQISQGIERVHNGCTRCRHAAGSLTLLGIPGKRVGV